MSSELITDNNDGGRNDGNSNGKVNDGVDGTTQPMTNGSTNHDQTSLADSSFPSTYDVSTTSTIDPVNPVYITPGLATGPSAGLGLTGYSPFSSTGDGSWTPTFDPMGLSGGYGFNHSGGVLNAPLQNQFFFPSNDPIGVWGQDSVVVNNSWLVNPVAMDPQTQITNPGAQVGIDVGSNINPVGTLGQSFSGMSLNGSMHSLIPTPTIIPTGVHAAPGQNVPPTQPAPIVQPPVAPPPQPEKPKSWAAIASQPAKPKPPPPQKQSPEIDTSKKQQQHQNQPAAWAGQSGGSGRGTTTAASVVSSGNNQSGRGPRRATVPKSAPAETSQTSSSGHSEVVSRLKAKNNYNPPELSVNMNSARFFVIKSYAEDDVHRSIKYNVWCSTEHGNRRLDCAYRDQKAKGANVFLFFSVNGSGHFCGVAQMASEIDFGSDTGLWTQDKWKGRFDLKWIYVKDVPNNQLRHIRLENNENKPVTNSRDTQEVPYDKGRAIMKLMHSYSHTTSIFDDFEHYEKRQEEDGAHPSNSGSKKDSRNS